MRLKPFLTAGLVAGLLFNSIQTKAQVQFGARAGINFSNAISKAPDGKKADYVLNPGFHVGATLDIAIADQFVLQPGLLFTQKGYQSEFITEYVTTANSATANYFEIPVNFIFKPELGLGKMLLGAGPYIGYGVGGRFKQTKKIWYDLGELGHTIDEEKTNKRLKYMNDLSDGTSADLVYGKPLDYGANLLAGYEFKGKYSAQLNAQLGLANLDPSSNGRKSGSSFKNVGFGISLGYKF